MMTLADIVQGIMGARPAWPIFAQTEVHAVVVDSRKVTPGVVFVAEATGSRDGHEFIPDALGKGAVAVIMEARGLAHATSLTKLQMVDAAGQPTGAPVLTASLQAAPTPLAIVVDDSLKALQRLARFWREQMPARIIGITGSVGKTTTKELVATVLSTRYATIKSEASYNNEIGLPLTLLRLRPHHQRAVLEMGCYVPGDIRFLSDIALPHIGVITNVGPSHLERMGSMEAIANTKAELIEALPPDGVAILNGDDARVRGLRDRTRARTVMYGLTPDCDVWADDLDSRGLEGIAFRVHAQGESLRVRVPLLGLHSVHTALRAIAVGLSDGMTWEEIIAGLNAEPDQIRLVVVPGVHGSTILDDTYNASPDSGLAALNLLKEMPGRRIAVLGDMLELGAYEAEGHELVGCRAAEVAQRLIAVGERSRHIAEAARSCGMRADAVEWFATNDEALAALRDELQAGDFVLVKGSRGVQMETIVAGLAADTAKGEA